VGQVLAKQTRDTQSALRALVQGDLAQFNTLLRSKGLKTIDVPAVVF
jgi:serine/threonine-protein kinase RIO1